MFWGALVKGGVCQILLNRRAGGLQMSFAPAEGLVMPSVCVCNNCGFWECIGCVWQKAL